MTLPVLHNGRWHNRRGSMPVLFSAAEGRLFAELLLEPGETYEARPENPGFRFSRTIAYGVRAGRYRRLPLAVDSER